METLRELQKQVQRQQKLLAEERSLHEQLQNVINKGVELSMALEKERLDVERLTKTSITALFYTMLGKKEEMLEKETREAYAAAAKYETAKRERVQLQGELEAVTEELAALKGCGQRYEQALQTRIGNLKTEDPIQGPKIVELEQKIAALKNRRNELREAINAGSVALSYAHGVQSSLDDAESWGTWDLLGGGGIITQIEKHDHLDEAQSKVQQLQRQLHRFKTELADVEIRADIQAKVDDFLGFADWFFDGMFVDWAVQDHIHKAQDQMEDTVWQINGTLDRLKHMEQETNDRIKALHTQLEQTALGSTE